VIAGVAGTPVRSQEGRERQARQEPLGVSGGPKIPRAAGQIVAIRAGRLFDARSGRMLAKSGDRRQGRARRRGRRGVQVPAGATVLDLGSATVLRA